MLKMMEKKSNDKGELIDRTAWFTRLCMTMICMLLSRNQSDNTNEFFKTDLQIVITSSSMCLQCNFIPKTI